MVLGILTFLSALTISAVAIYYSVAGLAAIFAAAVIPIIVMGVALEVGKLVTAVWLHRNWKLSPWWLKTYLSTAVVILMFITSMGIFGFLSKAHIEQTAASGESVAQVEQINKQIASVEAIISRAESTIEKTTTVGTGADQNIQAQIDKEQERIDTAYLRVNPAIEKVNEQLAVDTKYYLDQLPAIDEKLVEFEKLANIDTSDEEAVKKLQALVGARPDGDYGGRTARLVKQYKETLEAERTQILTKVEEVKSDAGEEIKRLRARAEKEIDDSNALITRLRSQLGQSTGDDIEQIIDENRERIKNANAELDTLTEKKFQLEAEYRKLEAEVGPIKYIAEFIYGEQADKNLLEEAVRWVIIVIIVVFDPLAVLLLIASQYSWEYYREERKRNPPPTPPTNNDPEPDPEPPFTDDEWDEAHRMNDEFDRAKKIAANVPPALSKKKENQYLLWADIDPDEQINEIVEEAETQVKTVEEQVDTDINEEKKYVDPAQQELDFSTNEVDNWNEWVEAANKAAAENPEEIEEEDDEFDLASFSDDEREAITIWKSQDERNSIKYQRKLRNQGLIKDWPWKKFLKAEPDFVEEESKFKIIPELEDELKGKAQYTEVVEPATVTWIEKEGKEQVKKSIEKENGYIQNAEQDEQSIWQAIKSKSNDTR